MHTFRELNGQVQDANAAEQGVTSELLNVLNNRRRVSKQLRVLQSTIDRQELAIQEKDANIDNLSANLYTAELEIDDVEMRPIVQSNAVPPTTAVNRI